MKRSVAILTTSTASSTVPAAGCCANPMSAIGGRATGTGDANVEVNERLVGKLPLNPV